MKDRDNLGSMENPGPGTYAQDKLKLVTTVKDNISNSFISKVSFTQSDSCKDSTILPDSSGFKYLQGAFLPAQSRARHTYQKFEIYWQA